MIQQKICIILLTKYHLFIYFPIMRKESQLDLFQKFVEKEQERSKITVGGEIEAIFDYCQYVIHTQYDKRSKVRFKFKERKTVVSEDFMRAYSTLQRQDKIMYYIKNVIYLVRIYSGSFKTPRIRSDIMQTIAYTKSYNLGRWKQKNMRLDNNRQIIYGENNGTIKQYDLGEYIFRSSKNTSYHTIVLQAIKQTVFEKNKTVHIGFETIDKMAEWADAIQLCIDFKHFQRIYIEINKKPLPKQSQISAVKVQKLRQEKPIQSLIDTPVTTTKVQFKSEVVTTSQNQNRIQKKQHKSKQEQIYISDQEPVKKQNKKLDEKMITRTIIQDLVQGEVAASTDALQSRSIQENKNKNMKNLNFFHKMFPDFQFNQVDLQVGFQVIHTQNSMKILQNTTQKQKYKLILQFQSQQNTPFQSIIKALSGTDFIKKFNQNVQEIPVKTFISSQNAAIIYMVLKQFNRIYRPRDFVFIRHCFKRGDNQFYIADKDLQNQNYPPFITIVRGKYQGIWTLIRRNSKIKLYGNIFMDNSGYLNDNQNTNLVLNYLKNYSRLSTFVSSNKLALNKFKLFDIEWDITKNKINQVEDEQRLRRKTQRVIMNQNHVNMLNKSFSPQKQNIQVVKKVQPISKQNQLLIQRQKMNMEQVDGQIDVKSLQNSVLSTNNQIQLRFDENGLVIIQKGFIKTRYQIVPSKQYQMLYWTSPNPGQHPVWTFDWKHDSKKGGLIFVNQKKLQDQKGVLKFVLSKIAKNLLQGKSILNISLPVDIFASKSNLELFIQSLCYAPILLEKSVKLDTIAKFKLSTAFGISMSSLYLIMEKPFNPILGQTFQAWVNGCPAYGEQISHHPPISALMFFGRGYTITGQFQSKAEMHMNSGKGTNDGIFRINFDDGTKICFCSAGGQVSGLTYGDRKFNVTGKGYCWCQNQNYFVEISYNPTKKGFFSLGKQEQPEDYFEGDAVQVTKQFIISLQTKRRAPTQKQIVGQLGKFQGIWNKDTIYEGECLLNIRQQLPCKLQYEKNPLPSDSNWREDIAYRRLMQVPRAQTQKERLEVIQRNDRKLRGPHKTK